MARKTHDLLADLDELGVEEQAPATKNKAGNKKQTKNEADTGEDALADIEKQLGAKRANNSRPSTPRASSTATSTTGKSEKRGADYTPASTSVGSSQRNSSEDRVRNNAGQQARTSGEAGRSYHQGVTPDAPEQPKQAASASGGGGWWGSVFNAATAAVKQAETLAKEISSNEEAQKWAEQMRGNFQNLQTFGTDLRTRALPTFTSLISHIAPPISAHERLQIHTTHDLQSYPPLDPLIYSVFSRVMSQVEGGDLVVLQRGSELRSRNTASSAPGAPETGYRGGVLGGSGNAWTDGPWWREETVGGRSLGVVAGVREGSRLARANAEAYAKEFFGANGGVEEAARRATEALSETNPVRSSDIFLAIQALSFGEDFGEEGVKGEEKEKTEEGVVEPEEEVVEEKVAFAVFLHDPIHSLSFRALSQPFPARWVGWLDAQASEGGLPESITDIIQSGGVDPREWVAEWIEEIISLAVGIVAQQYVAKRMGVGEGGLGRGKRRVEEDGIGGEAARAI